MILFQLLLRKEPRLLHSGGLGPRLGVNQVPGPGFLWKKTQHPFQLSHYMEAENSIPYLALAGGGPPTQAAGATLAIILDRLQLTST